MPKVSRESAQLDQFGPVEDRHAEMDGGLTVNFVTFGIDTDGTEYLQISPTEEQRVVSAPISAKARAMMAAQ